MGEAVRLGLAKLEEQKARYRTHGIAWNRPWMFLLTDGEPSDADWQQAAAESKAAEQANKLIFFGVGIGAKADLTKLAQFSSRKPVPLDGLKFREMFLWLSRSTSGAATAAQGTNVQLPSPSDWTQVSA